MLTVRLLRVIRVFTLLAVLLAACGEPSPTPSPVPPTGTAAAQPPATGEITPTAAGAVSSTGTSFPAGPTVGSRPAGAITPGAAEPTPVPAAPTSVDKIEAAEAAGTLDRDTALLYMLYAAYDLESLPAEYRGDDAELHLEGTTMLIELAERRERMEAALREKVKPFFLRPTDPGSFWQRAARQRSPSGTGMPKLAAPLQQGFTYAYVDSARTNTRVWYVVEHAEEAKKQAQDLAAEIDQSNMWGLEKRAMLEREPCGDGETPAPQNGGDGRLDVYLIPIGTQFSWQGREKKDFVHSGLAIPEAETGCGWSTYLLNDSSQDFPNLKSTMAHELFHAFQFAFKITYWGPDVFWWQEASATWAEDLVYPELNFEQNNLGSGEWSTEWNGRKLLGPLDRYKADTTYQYAAYIWPFYLSRRPGGRPEDIGSLWLKSQYSRPIDAMHDLIDWDASFKQFALWNLNTELADKYRDFGKHIEPLKQHVQCWIGDCRPRPGQYTLLLDLPHASMQYYTLTPLDDQPFRQLLFKLDGVTGQEGAGVQALITYKNAASSGGDQVLVDWSDIKQRRFCLDLEEVSKITVVVSNGNVFKNQRLRGSMVLDIVEESCGTQANLNYTVRGSYDIHSQPKGGQGTANGSISTSERVQSTWDVRFDERQGENIYYTFTATNHVDLEASAQLTGRDNSMQSAVSGQISGSRTSHNPTQKGDDGHGIRTYGSLVQQYNNTPQPREGGRIWLFKKDGRDAYLITLGITQVRPAYGYQVRIVAECEDAPAVYNASYSNETYTTVEVESGGDDCFNIGGRSEHTAAGPMLWGGVQLYRLRPGIPVGSHTFIAGYYDARSNVIEGRDDFGTQECRTAMEVDPLAYFVASMDSLVRVPHASFATDDVATSATCNLQYTASWRFELPKAGN